jgi:hypothetical protein
MFAGMRHLGVSVSPWRCLGLWVSGSLGICVRGSLGLGESERFRENVCIDESVIG